MSAADAIVRAIEGEFDVASPHPGRISEFCAQLSAQFGPQPGAEEQRHLQQLVALLHKSLGPASLTLFEFLAGYVRTAPDRWSFLVGMLQARDPELIDRALKFAQELAATGELTVGRSDLEALAACISQWDRDAQAAERLQRLRNLLESDCRQRSASLPDVLREWFLSDTNFAVRELSARVLDVESPTISDDMARAVLGDDAHSFLAPYLSFTRASHVDLLRLQRPEPELRALVDSLHRVESACGEQLLREVLAELGWPRVTHGLTVERVVGIRIGTSLPFTVDPCEAFLFDAFRDVQRSNVYYVFVAHGESGAGAPADTRQTDQVTRFRAFNLAHAEVLIDILDDAPLSPDVARRIISRMDGIVADFVALFTPIWTDTAILPGVYADLRRQVIGLLESEADVPFVSAELSRLVRTFEDPKTLGDVRTIHGLKRFLHQKGLTLGMKLAGGGAANRSVDLMMVDGPEHTVIRSITYADFEAEESEPGCLPAIPAPVRLLVEAYRRQLLYGCRSLPRASIYCYGNEIHYYLTFRNHPAFLRIDFSPPLYGGMIDLEYYGVSKYELANHPNIALNHLHQFLSALDVDVAIDNTRVQARYDKERALRIDDIRAKATELLCLVPYLMDLDWVIDSLDLSEEGRRLVTAAWIDRFQHWHVLPWPWILSEDRRGIVAETVAGPSGPRKILWGGGDCYRDRFARVNPESVAPALSGQLQQKGLTGDPDIWHGPGDDFGQLELEATSLHPLRQAVARRQLEPAGDALEARPSSLYAAYNDVEYFAEILTAKDDVIVAATGVADIVLQLEHLLPFATVGHINGHEVQKASLPFTGHDLQVYVLRDTSGVIRLAVYGEHGCLYRTRESETAEWQESASVDGPRLARLLRRSNYPLATDRGAGASDLDNVASLRRLFASEDTARPDWGSAVRRVILGIGAAPGRAFGRALFRIGDRQPDDFRDAILVAPMIRPEDSRFMYYSRGVVSTGGGILSHAGLLAAQFRKPALIVPGRWEQEADGKPALVYTHLQYTEKRTVVRGYTICVREHIRGFEHQLRDGDLIAVDAEKRTVTVLGQDADAVSLCDSLQRLGDVTASLRQSTDPHQVLTLRGHRLQIRHQLERVIRRLTDPVVAEHAILEILFADTLSAGLGAGTDREQLIRLFLQHPVLQPDAQRVVLTALHDARVHYAAASEAALQRIPKSNSVHEVLSLRLRAVQLGDAYAGLTTLLQSCGILVTDDGPGDLHDIEKLAWENLNRLRLKAMATCKELSGDGPLLRHRLRMVDQLDALLGEDQDHRDERASIEHRLARADAERCRSLASDWIVWPGDAGYELSPLVGWKAAHLAEIERLDREGIVPTWFAVTEAARCEMLSQPIRQDATWSESTAPTLGAAIRDLETYPGLSERERSKHIAALWESVRIPPELRQEILAAYHRLVPQGSDASGHDAEHRPFVAVRSSTCEEDAESASRAGEFDTFLFVTGEELLLSRIRQAWAGFWTERALVSRTILGIAPEDVHGSLVVQTMIRSRVSGVLQTVNVAQGKLDEIIVNAALGIGEGVVSGVTAADHVVIEKRSVGGRAPLSFRYLTLDKSEQIVFNSLTGSGTHRVPSLFHRRLRPALEYTELCELVSVAMRLESAYGYPIDMEFAFDDRALWILQVRPVASFVAALHESLAHYPLREPARAAGIAERS